MVMLPRSKSANSKNLAKQAVRKAQTKSMMDAGMDAVISKPFKVDDLVTEIRSILPKNGDG